MMTFGCVAIFKPLVGLDQLAASWTRPKNRRGAARQQSYSTGSWSTEHAHLARPAVGELAASHAARTIRVEHIVGPQGPQIHLRTFALYSVKRAPNSDESTRSSGII